ncbi:hypothetical protein IWQ61_008199 [Dispira simplex]|nr:hypothetical protein IWQ61_008199 [Dispira simplex]
MSLKGALTKNLKELRFHLCQTSPQSQGLREFLTKNYPAIKQANPGLPILIREAHGVHASIYARYSFARESKASVDGLTSSDIGKHLEQLIKSADSTETPRISQ